MLGRMEGCRDAEFRIYKGNGQVQRSRTDQRCGDREERQARNGDRGRHHESERRRENRRDRSDNRRPFRDRSYEKMRDNRSSCYKPNGYLKKEQTDSSSPTAYRTKSGWADMAEEFEKQTSIIQGELDRYQKKRHRTGSTGSSEQEDNSKANPAMCETDQVTLMRRQKQIDYGKNTLAYDNYSQNTPRHARKKDDPWTPTKFAVCSRRAWDGRIKEWRKKLHNWDPQIEQVSASAEGIVEEEACLDDVPDLELLDPMDIDKEQTFTI
ncbi:histone RNA hairpin-binding protein-like [Branchiostoma floridae]|uniref:Histone RNA hairpin-binding protein-like n=1 Tax=Branchiostoma floridae TaxID=7739 RepID=A0A9J7KDH3_BRAFL|nr:histone RNA hairpin-binding protein-like [Branchiostoma floridae]